MFQTLPAILATALVLAAGCRSAPERELSKILPQGVTLPNGRDPLQPDRIAQDTEDQLARTQGVLSYYEEKRGHALQVLELSGGGQNGAFGAGFINGWREAGTRPTFDIVTGVSSGALLATHVFLGTAEDDAQLKEIFTTLQPGDIYKKVGFLHVLLGKDALMDSAPLGKFLEKYITDEMIDRVARAHDDGRRLFVATTNLDYGQTWVWNMGLLAKRGDAEARTTYRKVLRAAASPPLAFPPVEVAGHLLADGATRANLLVVGLSGTERPQPPRFGPGNIYVIHNGKTSHPPRAITENARAIAGASLSAAMDSAMDSVTARAYLATRERGYEFHMASIPDGAATGHNPLAFDPAQMRAGFDAGYELGKSDHPWTEKPRGLSEYPEWIATGPNE